MSETTSFSSNIISSPIVETFVPKTMLETTLKLNGSNYLLWVQEFRIFIGTQKKLAHLLQASPATTDPTYVTWLTGDYSVMTRILNMRRRLVGVLCS